ncbi:MAG TPA: ABC transporter ATP-binding protein [Xanthobacteraceae bacterium]
MPEPVLRARGLSKRFGGLIAVDNVDFELYPHEIHSVIGPNGAGKSTFLAMLAGDLAPSAGSVMRAGRDVTGLTIQERTRLGIGRTYQRSAVIPGFAAIDMVRLAALHSVPIWRRLQPLASLSLVREKADQALGQVGLAGRRETMTDILSHGERRRLEIAAVLALGPQILLLDEPLAGLGPDEVREIAALIDDLRQSCAILLIEHDVDVVFAIANRITVLDNGRVIESGDPDAIRRSASVQEAYLGREGETGDMPT